MFCERYVLNGVRGALKGLNMDQPTMQYRKPDIAQACKIWIATVLYVSNHNVVSEQVLLDEGPIDEVEIRESLQDGRIAYPRTSPVVDRLKHVWRAKGHFPLNKDKTVELLVGEFKWLHVCLVLAQRINGEWVWVRG